jgi:putative ATP-dependent endonuclease of OLD family
MGFPLILAGENNSGKSNIAHALDIILGETWPNSEPEDHDFHNRDRDLTIEIAVNVDGVIHSTSGGHTNRVVRFIWKYPTTDGRLLRMVLDNGAENSYVSSDTREQCVCILIGADRRLSYQLSYASKYTFLSKLMRRFHQALTENAERVQRLKSKFEETKSTFREVESFTVFADELKRQVAEFSGNFEYGLQIDFSAYDPSNYFHALRINPHKGDETLSFDELGTGQEQMLALSFAYAYASAFHGTAGGLTLIIEEPEVHLHPLAQKWVATKIYELASRGVQIVVTTHSPLFLNVLNLKGIALLRKEDDATRVTQLTSDELASFCAAHSAAKATSDSILAFYGAAATDEIMAGLFSRKIVLVEGPSETQALPIYFNKLGLECSRNGIAVIPVHGVGNIAKWWRFFRAYGIPVYVIFDNDAEDDKESIKRNDILDTLSVTDEVVRKQLLEAKIPVVGSRMAVFGSNFEVSLRSLFGEKYVQLEREACDIYGLSESRAKPLVARYIADNLPYEETSHGWHTLNELKTKIAAL